MLRPSTVRNMEGLQGQNELYLGIPSVQNENEDVDGSMQQSGLNYTSQGTEPVSAAAQTENKNFIAFPIPQALLNINSTENADQSKLELLPFPYPAPAQDLKAIMSKHTSVEPEPDIEMDERGNFLRKSTEKLHTFRHLESILNSRQQKKGVIKPSSEMLKVQPLNQQKSFR